MQKEMQDGVKKYPTKKYQVTFDWRSLDEYFRHFRDDDLVKLEKLCMLHCTDPEIAGYFGVTPERIEQERQSPEFAAVMERGQAKGKIAIRRGQMRLLEKGSSMMAALLGRQVLGQREEVEATNRPIPVVVLPPIVPTKEDEIQDIALPNDRRHHHGSS